jgi:hypothetical protein
MSLTLMQSRKRSEVNIFYANFLAKTKVLSEFLRFIASFRFYVN